MLFHTSLGHLAQHGKEIHSIACCMRFILFVLVKEGVHFLASNFFIVT